MVYSMLPGSAPSPRIARQKSDTPRLTRERPSRIESLEQRTMLSVSATVETLINVSKMRENQTEASIAIDPTNPNRLFVASNMGSGRDADLGPNDPIPNEASLFGAVSTDAGVTWTTREFASGSTAIGGDNLPQACCDPSAEFDQFGNLWFTYLTSPEEGIEVVILVSTDGGASFTAVANLGGGDQPTITTGAGSVWVTWNRGDAIVASGATVTGLGTYSSPAGITPDPTGARGPFTAAQAAPASAGGNFGDIAIGPAGQVMVNYQLPTAGEIPGDIWTHVDPDGFGPQGFNGGVIATTTNVGGFDLIPAQRRRSVDAEANLEWDRSPGPFNGRVYMSYTNEAQFESASGNNADLDVFVRFSDDNGQHWSLPFLVNDDVGIGTPAPRAQFLPQIALDQKTGNIAIGFHDAREDTGADRNPNDDVQYFVAVGQPTPDRSSILFAPNVRVGIGQSDAKFADNGIDFGDYTGITFDNNTVYPAYADNSNSTRDNPAGARRSFDIYTGRVRVAETTVVPPAAVTPSSPLAPTVVKENSLIRKGRTYNLNVSYTAPGAPAGTTIDVSTLGDDDLTVTGPGGFTRNMELRGFRRRQRGTSVLARYRMFAPGTDARWDSGDNGVYTITLNGGSVRATNGTAVAAGIISKFLVTAPAPRTPGAGRSLALTPGGVDFNASTTDAKRKNDDLRQLLA